MSVQRPWRLFVALPVPAHVRVLAGAAAAPVRDEHPELTWTRPEGWHVTLAFLGDVGTDRVDEVEAVVGRAVAQAGVGPIGCALGEPGRFRGTAMWLEVLDDPVGAIGDLGGAIQTALADTHLPVHRQEVRPHLTLARASRRGAAIDDEVVAQVAGVDARWEAAEVELVRSHVGGGPARYEPIATWPLA